MKLVGPLGIPAKIPQGSYVETLNTARETEEFCNRVRLQSYINKADPEFKR